MESNLNEPAMLAGSCPSNIAGEIESRFGDQLLRLANRRLDRRLTARVDEHDVLQSVLKSFFQRHMRGEFVIESWLDVWGLLALMTKRKCVEKAQIHFAGRRDARRDIALNDPLMVHGQGEPQRRWGLLPSDPILLAEAANRLSSQLTDRERDVLTLAMTGRTVEQISAELGRTQRTVRRLLQRVRERLERMAAEVR